jgi:biotin synthase
MNRAFYAGLADQSIAGTVIDCNTAYTILTNPQIELIALLNSAFEVRKQFTGKEVSIHIINNGQNGHCPEDCHYCPQARSSNSDIEEYPIKSDEEFLAEAKNAYEKGAFRYCMVFSGRGPSLKRTEHLSKLIRTIKEKYPIQICVSTGLLDQDKANMLKEAGLDRLNHNLNTSERHYPEICTTHTYTDRLNTLQAARNAGIQLCSGLIVGMGETHQDIVEVAYKLRELKSESIPVNLFIPIEGHTVKNYTLLTPDYCLRILCLFRFLNPKAEIRVAAGREIHLRSMEVLALYPANSLFMDGYLNTKGSNSKQTLQMIKDAGFSIKSDHELEEVLAREEGMENSRTLDPVSQTLMKGLKELRPTQKTPC